MASIKIMLDPERLTVGDLIDMEAGSLTTCFMRDFLARFVVGEDGNYLKQEDGVKAINQLNLKELRETTAQFTAEVARLQETLVPLESEGN